MKKIILLFFISLFVIFTGCEKVDDNKLTNTTKTEYSESESLNDNGNLVEVIITVTDKGEGTGTITWESTKTYILNGLVFVNNGQTLTIEPGTIIKGKSGQGENASALIVAQGGKIKAEGTQTSPILFLAESDNTKYDHTKSELIIGNNIPATTRGLWGGLIILGNAPTNNSTILKSIEGIPTTEERAKYGGNDEFDNSGIIKYVSIRNGGADIGEGNEINGLTLGAVGSGTLIDYVEVIGNKDDGFEWFGGNVKATHLVSAFNGDDSFDYDEGFYGKGQFWFVIQDPTTGDRIGEHDGGPSDNEFGQPFAKPTIYNVTYIGRGEGYGKRLITFRDNAGGFYYNSIFANQERGIDIEWVDGSGDSYKQFENGNLKIENNIFDMVADDTSIFKVSGDNVPVYISDIFKQYFTNGNNEILNTGIKFDIYNLNPVPIVNVSNNLYPYGSEFDNVNYKGAFKPDVDTWLIGWSKISEFIK